MTGRTGPTRRELLLGALGGPFLAALHPAPASPAARRIDRQGLVRRHKVILTAPDVHSPLQVGNGEFAVTVDITGLQTFAEAHERAMPLGTMAQWAWHSFPNSDLLETDDIYTEYDSHGRRVPYADGGSSYPADAPPRTKHPAVWRRANPHRIDLGRLGLGFGPGGGSQTPTLSDVEDPRQELDLWTGAIDSRFSLWGQTVAVTTVCHPQSDTIAVRVRSPLVTSGRLGLSLTFPYPAGEWRRTVDWEAPASLHQTLVSRGRRGARVERVIDDTRYIAAARWSPRADLSQPHPHRLELFARESESIELSVEFSLDSLGEAAAFDTVLRASADYWKGFWTAGGSVDLSGSGDPRAPELERRVVLSQYLTAVNCAGSVPPQETGLVTNSWYGKHHLEMHWWHAAHFALWGRADLLRRSMGWYRHVLPRAREIARRQGYRGARWPKQVGPDGIESPSTVAVFLIWQQPHPIYLAELLHRAQPEGGALERYADLVFETAEFMASFAAWDGAANRYVLGPPLIPAQETYGPIRTRVINPTFELAYWAWGLSTAQAWRERLGLRRDDAWDRVMAHLARPAERDGVYAAIEVPPFTERTDHPSMLAALGFLPKTPLVDAGVMRRTLADVRRNWDWETTWGWDYAMMAMTAARVGEPGAAVDALLMDAPKNRYLRNGHNYQTSRLPLYLPGNGGLLYAVALMAAGWEGSKGEAPGFPSDGGWRVRAEGLRTAV
jgi:hypothetical protein